VGVRYLNKIEFQVLLILGILLTAFFWF